MAVIWSRYFLARYHVARGRLVVFDRYVYDADVPTPYPLGLAGRVGRWIDGRCCPAPDLVLLLDAPGEVMYRRKPSYTPEMLESWRQHFLRVRQRVSCAEVLDTTRGVDEVRNQATAHVWRQYTRRWRRVGPPGERRG
jgi:thymidylate kinase